MPPRRVGKWRNHAAVVQTGRHAALKRQCPQGLVGSNPTRRISGQMYAATDIDGRSQSSAQGLNYCQIAASNRDLADYGSRWATRPGADPVARAARRSLAAVRTHALAFAHHGICILVSARLLSRRRLHRHPPARRLPSSRLFSTAAIPAIVDECASCDADNRCRRERASIYPHSAENADEVILILEALALRSSPTRRWTKASPHDRPHGLATRDHRAPSLASHSRPHSLRGSRVHQHRSAIRSGPIGIRGTPSRIAPRTSAESSASTATNSVSSGADEPVGHLNRPSRLASTLMDRFIGPSC